MVCPPDQMHAGKIYVSNNICTLKYISNLLYVNGGSKKADICKYNMYVF